MRSNSLITRHINRLFDNLEEKLHNQEHLTDNVVEVQTAIDKCAKFWGRLDDGERDFINAARYVVKDRKPWK